MGCVQEKAKANILGLQHSNLRQTTMEDDISEARARDEILVRR